MGVTHDAKCHAGCHTNVTSALLEFVAARHHVAAALAAFAEARLAPDEWHRSRAMTRVFSEIDAAEARLVAMIETEPGIEAHCRAMMVRIDGITGEVHAWVASRGEVRAKVIDFPTRPKSSQAPRRRRAENRPRVNNNLHVVTDDAPAAC